MVEPHRIRPFRARHDVACPESDAREDGGRCRGCDLAARGGPAAGSPCPSTRRLQLPAARRPGPPDPPLILVDPWRPPSTRSAHWPVRTVHRPGGRDVDGAREEARIDRGLVREKSAPRRGRDRGLEPRTALLGQDLHPGAVPEHLSRAPASTFAVRLVEATSRVPSARSDRHAGERLRPRGRTKGSARGRRGTAREGPRPTASTPGDRMPPLRSTPRRRECRARHGHLPRPPARGEGRRTSLDPPDDSHVDANEEERLRVGNQTARARIRWQRGASVDASRPEPFLSLT